VSIRQREWWGGFGAPIASGAEPAALASEALVSTAAPVRTVVSSPAVALPAQREPAHSRGVPRWVCLVVADAVAVAGCAALVDLVHPTDVDFRRVAFVAVMVVTFLIALMAFGAYTRSAEGLIRSPRSARSGIWQALPLGVLLALLTGQAVQHGAGEWPGLEQAGLVALLGVAAIPTARTLVPALVMPRQRVRRVLILGTGHVAARVAARLRRCSGVLVVNVVDDDPRDTSSALGMGTDLLEICVRHRVDAVVVAFSRQPVHETLESLRVLQGRVPVWVVPRLYELVSWRSVIEELHGIPLLDVAPGQVGPAARATKRIFDVVIAGMLLIMLSPVFAAVAVAIKLDSPGPVMFRQFRSGQHRQPFRMYKFRTMANDAEQRRAALAEFNEVDGPIFKMTSDPRVTRVGGWLRQTSIDELPQLINVLRGEMSLVGPRPFPIAESDQITGWATIRFSAPPGITGLWQVSGRNALDYEDLRHLDYIYVASWSFGWDLRILLQTPASVLFRRGVL
jgi:exopolysaccharide biosynthesis polyprenyl glycosylphosphotransferase